MIPLQSPREDLTRAWGAMMKDPLAASRPIAQALYWRYNERSKLQTMDLGSTLACNLYFIFNYTLKSYKTFEMRFY